MRKEHVFTVDDLALLSDPAATTPADKKVCFAIDGEHREMDLSAENAGRFYQMMDPWIAASRKMPAPHRQPRRNAAQRKRSAEIRAWAIARGLQVSERGRIPADIVEQFGLEHGN